MLHLVAIGINEYRHPAIRDLSCARSDAEVLATLFETQIDPSERTVRRLFDQEATKRNILIAVGEELPRVVGPGDVVIIYFAGHGTPETNGPPDDASRYLVAHDTDHEAVYADGIDMERELARWCERLSGPAVVLILLDACFSGRAGGRTFEGPHLRRARSALRSSVPISLKDLDLGEGRVMIGACADDQVARESPDLGHGIFTHFLLRALKQSVPGEPTISLSALYDEVGGKVKRHTRGRQVPTFNGRSLLASLPRLG
jgi:uncharacterized caspase-like protein